MNVASVAAFLITLIITGPFQTEASRPTRKENAEGILAHKECPVRTTYPFAPDYKTQPQDLKEYEIHSRCHGLSSLGDALLITTTYNTDTSWFNDLISIPYMVYHAGGDNTSHSHPNHGNEAMGYLMFMAEYYDCLPNVTLFAHPHRSSSWHSTGNLDYNIDRVRWDAIPGYAVLHRRGQWWDMWVRDTKQNLLGAEEPVPDNATYQDCDAVSVDLISLLLAIRKYLQ